MKAVDTLRFHLNVGARLFTPSVSPSARQLPLRGSLLVRFISLHIKPALKGEVANVVSRRGYKAAYSSLFVTTPQSNLRFASSP